MSIFKKAKSALKKAMGSKAKRKNGSYNTGRSWSMDRVFASSEEYEKAYAPKRKKAYKTRKKK